MLRVVFAVALFLSCTIATAGNHGLRLECKIIVPPAYKSKIDSPGFPGTSPFARYSQAYQAFWWNCVAVRAVNINARCPFVASGWASESYGAAYGAMNADNAIDNLVKKYGAPTVQAYLKKLASPPSKITAKLGGWFMGKPTPAPTPSSSDY